MRQLTDSPRAITLATSYGNLTLEASHLKLYGFTSEYQCQGLVYLRASPRAQSVPQAGMSSGNLHHSLAGRIHARPSQTMPTVAPAKSADNSASRIRGLRQQTLPRGRPRNAPGQSPAAGWRFLDKDIARQFAPGQFPLPPGPQLRRRQAVRAVVGLQADNFAVLKMRNQQAASAAIVGRAANANLG